MNSIQVIKCVYVCVCEMISRLIIIDIVENAYEKEMYPRIREKKIEKFT